MDNTLVLLYSCKLNLKKVKTCLNTWAEKIPHLLLICDEVLDFPVPQLVVPSFGYQKLSEKTALMWKMLPIELSTKYEYFLKVDDDTCFFPQRMSRKTTQEKWEFFGNTKRHKKPNPADIDWVNGSSYGLSKKAAQKLREALHDGSSFKKFCRHGPAEDVATSLLLKEQGIGAQHWDEMYVQEARRLLRNILLRKTGVITVANLTPAQMRILWLLRKVLP